MKAYHNKFAEEGNCTTAYLLSYPAVAVSLSLDNDDLLALKTTVVSSGSDVLLVNLLESVTDRLDLLLLGLVYVSDNVACCSSVSTTKSVQTNVVESVVVRILESSNGGTVCERVDLRNLSVPVTVVVASLWG